MTKLKFTCDRSKKKVTRTSFTYNKNPITFTKRIYMEIFPLDTEKLSIIFEKSTLFHEIYVSTKMRYTAFVVNMQITVFFFHKD